MRPRIMADLHAERARAMSYHEALRNLESRRLIFEDLVTQLHEEAQVRESDLARVARDLAAREARVREPEWKAKRGPSVMLQKFASSAFVIGTLLMASMPAVGLARDHGGQGFSRGSHGSAARGFSGAGRYSGGQSFVSPRGYEGRRGYAGGPSYYGRGYGRPVYRGVYGGGVYLGYGGPYGYAYGPSYVYTPGYGDDPGYSYGYGPAPAPQGCAQGSYDQYGTWIPNPNCYSGQQQYAPPQQNYNPNQQQYAPPQQNYNPNQQQYARPQQNYDPYQQQR